MITRRSPNLNKVLGKDKHSESLTCLLYTSTDYEILLYYKYVDVEDPEEFRSEQFELCKQLDLKGRIIVSKEGINGTVEGKKQNTQKYIEMLKADERFVDTHFKPVSYTHLDVYKRQQ